MRGYSDQERAAVLAIVQQVYPTAQLGDIVYHKHRCDTFLLYRWCLWHTEQGQRTLVALGTTRGMVQRYVAGILAAQV